MQNRADKSTLIIVISIILLVLGSVACLVCANCMSSNSASIWGGVLSAVATTLLGGIAVWQNKRYKDLADEKSKQAEELMFTPECRLFGVYTNSQMLPYRQTALVENGHGQNYYLYFSSLNLTMIDIKVEEISFCEKSNNSHMSVFHSNEMLVSGNHSTIFEGGIRFEININMPPEFMRTDTICRVKLSYKNIYDSVVHKTVEFERAANGNTKITKQERAILIGKIVEDTNHADT